MNTVAKDIPIITPDAGDTTAQADPNSPASIAKRARELESQSAADMKYDARAPPRVEAYEDWIAIQWDGEETKSKEITMALFLTTAVILLLYAAAPNPLKM